MARSNNVTVAISCDNTGACCARPVSKRNKGEVCGMDYKFPFSDFGVTKSQKNEMDRGYTVRKIVGRFTWFDMVDAWGESGLFGRSRRRRRRRRR